MPAKELRLAASCLVLIWLAACGGGNVALRQAQKAELRKDWDTALVDYEKARRDHPENAKVLIHEQLVRVQASAFHLKQGQRLLKEGRPDEASGEFQKAVSIDPTNEAAAQELARVVAAQAAAKQARESALKQALKAGEEGPKGPEVKLKALLEEPLTHLRIPNSDSRKVYEALAKLANLNIAFTSNFRTGPLSEDLSDVKIGEALDIVALQTHTFWRPITPNTILVAPDTPADRTDYGEQELKTIYLSNPMATADRTALTTALRTILQLKNIADNPDANAIIIRDTPEKVAAAEQLVHDLDRGKAEILMEVAVVEADRDRARDLGLYPVSVSTSGTTNGLQGGLIFSPPSVTTSTGTTTATGITPNTFGIGDFALVVPSVAANAILNDTRTHILENPQLRSTDGQVAKLKIGERVPYATGSFLPTLGTTTTSTGLLASTQFQFQDVGVILELTPHLLADGEVAIHANIEISSVGANVTVGGVSEPTFGERKIEHDIRLKEGETSVLGGLIQTTLTNTVGGVPILGDIPLLRYLFSTEHAERQEEEVLVMLTPRVIRLPEPHLGTRSNVTLAGEPQPAGMQPIPGPGIPGQPPAEPQ